MNVVGSEVKFESIQINKNWIKIDHRTMSGSNCTMKLQFRGSHV